jgi:hypothetical protein
MTPIFSQVLPTANKFCWGGQLLITRLMIYLPIFIIYFYCLVLQEIEVSLDKDVFLIFYGILRGVGVFQINHTHKIFKKIKNVKKFEVLKKSNISFGRRMNAPDLKNSKEVSFNF